MPIAIKPVVVDLFHGDNVSDFKLTAKAGVLGVIHKATEGLSYKDPTYKLRKNLALDAGLLWGAYHFLRPDNMQAQCDFFLNTVQPDEHTLVALDHEDRKVPLVDAIKFLHDVNNALGRKAVLYSGFLIKEQLGNKPDPWLGSHRLWLAQYGTAPKWPKAWDSYWLLQFTGDGVGPKPHEMPGITTKGIDINSYSGTPDQLKAEWAT